MASTDVQDSVTRAVAITDTALVVYNSGGYTIWVDKMLADRPGIKSVDTYSLTSDTTTEKPPTSHVFYDLNVTRSVNRPASDHQSKQCRILPSQRCRVLLRRNSIAISEHAIASNYP